MILINTEISVKVFIDIFFVYHYKLFTQKLQNSQMLQLADDSFISAEIIYKRAILDFRTHQHSKKNSNYLTKLNFFISIIFSLEWFRMHDSSISWTNNILIFNFNFCHYQYLHNDCSIIIINLIKKMSKCFNQY